VDRTKPTLAAGVPDKFISDRDENIVPAVPASLDIASDDGILEAGHTPGRKETQVQATCQVALAWPLTGGASGRKQGVE